MLAKQAMIQIDGVLFCDGGLDVRALHWPMPFLARQDKGRLRVIYTAATVGARLGSRRSEYRQLFADLPLATFFTQVFSK